LIARNLRISLDEAEEKHEAMQRFGRHRDYLIIASVKRDIENIDSAQRCNFTILSRIMPDLRNRLSYRYSRGELLEPESDKPVLEIVRGKSISDSIFQIGLLECDGTGKALIRIDTEERKAWITALSGDFEGLDNYLENAPGTSDEDAFQFGCILAEWLERFYVDGYRVQWKNDPTDAAIPDFELGKVQLTKAHKNAGITQPMIDQVNQTQTGIIVFPRRGQNEANEFEKVTANALISQGFKIDARGKMKYGGVSQRT
jgi:hypothetical protein